ncbi:MAG: M1 family aminopeptidase [Bacteroidia bacterium]
MYKYGILTVFYLIFYTATAQIFEPESALAAYQSEDNALYWKNRKPFPGYWQQDVSYHIKAKLNDTTEIITGSETLEYANNSPDTIYKLYFRLTQNAFQPGSYKDEMETGGKVFNKFGKYEKEKLGTKITKVVIAGNELQFTLDNTIMIIDLPTPLYPGKTMKMEIDFKTYFDQGTMGRRMKRFEHNNFKHFDGVHWYPRLSVYDRKFKWTTDQHLGKEFYGDYGIYYVELELPNQYICEATGVLTNSGEVYAGGLREKIDIKNFTTPSKTISTPVIPNGTYKRWIWMANNVHDFAFTTDPTYRIGEVEWNGIKCIALAQEQNAYAWQPTAQFVANVVKIYSQDFGMYAYPKMVAADARDGMEYPMLTLDGGNWPNHQYVIAHEVGHNWFFGMVGNNETYRACLDEGFTQFLTAWSIKKLANKDYTPNPIDWAYVYAGYLNHAINENTARLNTHSDHFNSAERHGGGYGQVYYKTATMLYNLQYVLGDKLFLDAMKHYFNQWKFAHPYEEDFRQSIIDYTKVDLNWFFDDWLTTTKTIDYKIKRVTKVSNAKYDYLVEIKRKGDLHMPLDITVIEKNGNRLHYHIPNTYFTKTLGKALVNHRWISWDMMNKTDMLWVQSQNGIANVFIDTTGRLADINRLNNSLKFPFSFEREKLTIPAPNFNKLQNYWRSDVWYNAVDGIKVGLNFSGNYYNFKHIYSATIWYNTNFLAETNDLANMVDTPPNFPINLALTYKTRVGKLLDYSARVKYLDGLSLFETGFEKLWRNDKWSISYKAFGLQRKPFLKETNDVYIHLLYPKYFEKAKCNATLNLSYQHPFRYRKGNGLLNIGLRNTALFSDFNYSGLTIKINNTNPIGKKLILKSRIFTQYLHGNVPKESSLFAAGANNEELIENKFTRSRGIVPNEMIGYGNTGQYAFQMGGGLNIRGMAGYQATNTKGQDTFYIFNGNKGAAINLELEFGKLFKINSPKFLNNFKFNPYLFADAGILGNGNQYSGLRADAGLGTTLAINFGKYNKLQPLVLRFDVPFFLNRVETGAEYVDFRYVVGINRAF